MSAPYISLGIYKPSRWNARQIGRDLLQMTRKAGFVPHDDPKHGPLVLKGKAWSSLADHAEVRRRTFKKRQAEDWHYDGDTTEGSKPDCWLILWASNSPTMIKRKDHTDQPVTIYAPKPYELVAFKNMECLHRRPPNVPRIRWVFRQRAQRFYGEE